MIPPLRFPALTVAPLFISTLCLSPLALLFPVYVFTPCKRGKNPGLGWFNSFNGRWLLGGQLVKRQAVVWVGINIRSQLVRGYPPVQSTTKVENHVSRYSATASPVNETLNCDLQLFRQCLRSASALYFFLEDGHADESKRYV